jgi:hypothetical protein
VLFIHLLDQSEIFEHALIEASNNFLKEAKKYKELNQTALAIEKMKKYKYYQQELSVLHSRKQMGINSIPFFTWKTYRKEEKVENIEIAENEMKLQISGLVGIEGLINTHNHRTIALIVNFGKGTAEKDDILEIPGVKADGSSVEYNFSRTLPILKRSKLAQQLYSRKKITVELLMNKGLFRGQYSVAMTVLPLADLLNKSTVGGDLPLYSVEKASDGGSNKKGKLIGGMLKMTVTIRTPLVTPEMKIIEERELVIEEWPSAATVSWVPSVPVTAVLPPSAPALEPKKEMKSNESSVDPNHVKLLELGKQLTEKEKHDPENIEFIVSNDVFEAEIQAIESVISSGKMEDEGDELPLRIKLQTLQAKLQLLVYSVQNETLSLEDYLSLLKERIEKDKKMILYQKFLGTPESKTIALKLLKRVKIMETEIKNAAEG